MSINSGIKSQGKKQDATQPKQNQSRGNKKWNTNNNNTINGGNARSGNYQNSATNNNKSNGGFGRQVAENYDLTCHMHDRMLYLLGNIYGNKIHVTVCNGTKFEGVFQGATTEGDLSIALTFARKIYDPTILNTDKSKSSLQPVLPSLLIFAKDLMEIVAVDTDLTTGDIPHQDRKNTFKTDTDISGKGENRERELHKWNPELLDGGVLESLEDGSELSNSVTSWDQFAANEKLFGLKTDFDEELYTTRLDRSAPGYKDREKWAIEKANEIQQSATTNPHMLEERNLNSATDSGIDEEDRYGAVIRDKQEKENGHVTSAVHKQHAPKSQNQHGDFANLPPDSPLHKLARGNLTTSSPSRYEPTKLKKTGNEKQASKRIESEVVNTFRQFAMLEKDKLQAKRQALHKKEQSDRLADLVKFHKTFELNVPVPPDMLPLLSKSKKSLTSTSSGSHFGDKSSLASSSESTQESTTTTSKTTSPTKTAAPAAMASNKKPDFKFNIKASEFKPNPAAAAFVPGDSKIGTPSEKSHTTSSTNRLLKNGPVTVDDIFTAPFAKWKNKKPSTTGPTWPYGSQQYRHQFNHYNQYTEDIFTGYPTAAYGYGYPQYHYHQQYVAGMPVMPFQQQHASYMNPQFVPNVPITASPIHHAAYSHQMPNGSPHASSFSQGYSSPQRSPMSHPNGIPPPQMYQYHHNPSQGGSVPMLYTPDMMVPTSGTPVMMHQRMTMEHTNPGTTHYPPPRPSMNYPPEQKGSPSQADYPSEP